MGCVFISPLTVSESIQTLKRVESVIQQTVDKNNDILEQEKSILKSQIRTHSKASNLQRLKKIKMMENHILNYLKRLNACIEKRLQLESLHISYQHIEAVKTTSYTFKKYLKANDIEKIEALHDSVTDMIQNVMDIQETISEEHHPLLEDDLEAELQALIETQDGQSARKDVVGVVETHVLQVETLEPAPIHLPSDQQQLLSYTE
tara:strand:+ start:842 stop:1456 length:615 start_codon:yes stop_codon:yes gene_type:complete